MILFVHAFARSKLHVAVGSCTNTLWRTTSYVSQVTSAELWLFRSVLLGLLGYRIRALYSLRQSWCLGLGVQRIITSFFALRGGLRTHCLYRLQVVFPKPWAERGLPFLTKRSVSCVVVVVARRPQIPNSKESWL